MFIEINTVYADAFKCLKHKERNVIALSVQGSADEYLSMNSPLDVSVEGGRVFFSGRKFLCLPKQLTREGVKTTVIKSRYSNDDQIAIMLNKGKSSEDAVYYRKMQEWREFAGVVAEKSCESG